jgi:biotin carboxyl carrier protein
MDPIAAAARMDADEIVPPSEIRAWLEVLITSSYQTSGVRRIKNPRIWSLHDLEVLFGGMQVRSNHAEPEQSQSSGGKPEDEEAPEGVTVVFAPMAGTLYHQSAPGEPSFAPVGATVESQATLALIEVMKSLTPVRNGHRGRVRRWLVSDGEAVSAGQALVWLDSEST